MLCRQQAAEEDSAKVVDLADCVASSVCLAPLMRLMPKLSPGQAMKADRSPKGRTGAQLSR
jgi:hypothetical protein